MTTATMTPTSPTAILLKAVAAYAGAKDTHYRAHNHPADALAAFATATGVDLDVADRQIQYVLSEVLKTMDSALLEMDIWCVMQNQLIDNNGLHSTSSRFRESTLYSRRRTAQETYLTTMADIGIEPDQAETALNAEHARNCGACSTTHM